MLIDSQVLRAIAPQVKEVYSGKPGCGCGCRGNYSKAPSSITKVLNKMHAGIDKVSLARGLNGEFILSLELANRYYWAYTA